MIYIAVNMDRHIDPEIKPYTTAELAIAAAKQMAYSWVRGSKRVINEYEVPGRLYHADYSCEGDCVYVVETKLDEEV